jgi:hypothetical protein
MQMVGGQATLCVSICVYYTSESLSDILYTFWLFLLLVFLGPPQQSRLEIEKVVGEKNNNNNKDGSSSAIIQQ